MKRLEGKTALITGGGTGIGAAIARRFVMDGARVCIAGRRQKPLQEVAEALSTESAVLVAGDVTDPEDRERMIRTALGLSGRLDILVNNAAAAEVEGPLADLDPATWQRVIDVNLTAPFLLMRASIQHMIKGGGGSIINISSLAGLRCIPGMPAYSASKAGLIMLTQQAALDYGPHNIRCNSVCPGGVKTPLIEPALKVLARSSGKSVEQILERPASDIPLKRFAEPDEIAGICSYLASDDSSFVTGATIVIDGGASIVDPSGGALVHMVSQAVQDRSGTHHK
jgi:meso-butanediol dehydrogenase / (S,S)-butanediol dehydrogenase / diacetyl reductase